MLKKLLALGFLALLVFPSCESNDENVTAEEVVRSAVVASVAGTSSAAEDGAGSRALASITLSATILPGLAVSGSGDITATSPLTIDGTAKATFTNFLYKECYANGELNNVFTLVVNSATGTRTIESTINGTLTLTGDVSGTVVFTDFVVNVAGQVPTKVSGTVTFNSGSIVLF